LVCYTGYAPETIPGSSRRDTETGCEYSGIV